MRWRWKGRRRVVVVTIIVVIIMDQAIVGHVAPSILTLGTICFVVLLGCMLKFSGIFFESFPVKISAHRPAKLFEVYHCFPQSF
jgi:hypothetical protein